jgi:hypothetical protein
MIDAPQRQNKPIKRVVLAVELLLGVLPITIIGGVYGAMGLVFGSVSILVALSERTYPASLWWLGVFALALGGLVGILGLWLLIAASELGGTKNVRFGAWAASIVGVITAVVALTLALSRGTSRSWLTIYLLVSPILVVCHRGYRSLRTASVR